MTHISRIRAPTAPENDSLMPWKPHDVTSAKRSSHISSCISWVRRIVFRARHFHFPGIGLPRTPQQHLDICSGWRDERASRLEGTVVGLCIDCLGKTRATQGGRDRDALTAANLIAVFRPHGCRQLPPYEAVRLLALLESIPALRPNNMPGTGYYTCVFFAQLRRRRRCTTLSRELWSASSYESQECREDAVLGLQHLAYATARQKLESSIDQLMLQFGKNILDPRLPKKTSKCRVYTTTSPVQGTSLICSIYPRAIDAMAHAYATRFYVSCRLT